MEDWTVETWVRSAAYSALLAEPPQVWKSTSQQVMLIRKLLEEQGVRKGLILDAGCGAGRITVALAEYGYDVLGIDISPKLVKEAESRIVRAGVEGKARCIVGDIRRLQEYVGDMVFDAIISWYSSFGFYGDEIDKAVLRQFAWVSKSDGLLLLDVDNRDSLLKARNYREEYTWSMEVEDKLLVIRSKYNYWTSMEEMEVEVYERDINDMKIIAKMPMKSRLYSAHELAKLLRESGWKPLKLLGDWSGRSFTLTSPRLIFVAKRE